MAAGVMALAAGACDTMEARERRAARAVSALGGARTPGVWTTRVYEGEATIEGHFATPHETRTVPTRLAVTKAPGEWGESVEWTLWWDGKAGVPTTRTLRRAGGLIARNSGETAWHKLSWADEDWAWVLVRDLDARDVLEDSGWVTPGKQQRGGEPRLVYEGERLQAAEFAYGHERLGDVVDRVEYRSDGTVHVTLHRPDDIYQFTLRMVSETPAAGPPPDPRETGETIEPARQREQDRAPTIAAIGENLHEVVHEGVDTRMLVAEFADHLIVMEAGVNARAGEVLADAITTQWPGKPVRYVIFSHHHPHYTGGLRAFIAAGATVITPPERADLVREIAALPFTRVPDRLARSPRPVKIETFTGTRVFDDGTNRLEAIDIGILSNHTAEYVVFWFPRQRVLFEGDIGFFGSEGAVRASRRATGLLQAIDERGLPVERIVQSWPVVGSPASLGMEEFRALVTRP